MTIKLKEGLEKEGTLWATRIVLLTSPWRNTYWNLVKAAGATQTRS